MFKDLLEEIQSINPPKILSSCIKTPDDTILISRNRHDYVTHEDANGETYMLDGGSDYQRRSVNNIPPEDLSVWTNSPYEHIRENLYRGGRGKLGNLPLKYVPHCKMSNAWLKACIEFDTGHNGNSIFIKLYALELAYREEQNIYISDDDENKEKWSKNGF